MLIANEPAERRTRDLSVTTKNPLTTTVKLATSPATLAQVLQTLLA